MHSPKSRIQVGAEAWAKGGTDKIQGGIGSLGCKISQKSVEIFGSAAGHPVPMQMKFSTIDSHRAAHQNRLGTIDLRKGRGPGIEDFESSRRPETNSEGFGPRMKLHDIVKDWSFRISDKFKI